MDEYSSPSSQKRILVAGGNSTACSEMRTLLKDTGYAAKSSGSVSETVQLIPEYGPELLMLSSAFPDGSGLDVCHHVRAMSLLDIPSILYFYEEAPTSEEQADTIEAGIDDSMILPVGKRELLARVDRLLGTPLGKSTSRDPNSFWTKIWKDGSLLQTVFSQSPFPMWISDAEGMVVSTNQALLDTLKLRKEQVLGHYNVHKDGNLERAGIMPRIKRVFEHHERHQFSLSWKGDESGIDTFSEARNCHIDANIYPVLRNGELHRVVCQWVDVTDRVEAQTELERTEAILYTALESSQAGIAIADVPDGKLRYVNRAGLLIRGRSKEEIVDGVDIKKYVDIWQIRHFDGTPYEPEDVPLARAVLKGETCTEEFVIHRSDHENVDVWATAAPVLNSLDEVIAGVIVFLDISEWKRSAEATRENEELFRATFENAPFGAALLKDSIGCLDMVNTSFCQMLGYEQEELIGRTLSELTHPEDREEIIANFDELSQGRVDSFSVEKRYIHKSNKIIWANYRMCCVRNSEGKPVRLLAMFEDTTVRLRYERRLRRLNAILNSIRDVNQLIVREKNPTQLIHEVANILVRERGFQRVICTRFDENQKIVDIAISDAISQSESTIRKHALLEKGELPPCFTSAREIGGVVTCPQGDSVCDLCKAHGENNDWLHLCGLLIHDGELFGMLIAATGPSTIHIDEEKSLFEEVCGDIGFALNNINREKEKRHAYEQMAEAKEQAENANQSREEFLAVMSHELRTPLNPILGYTSLLLNDAEEPEREILQTMLHSGERMIKLIDRILEYSRLDRSNIKQRATLFKLVKACRDSFASFESFAGNLSYEFRNGGDGLLPIKENTVVVTDRDMVERILENLIQNACKYTEKGGVTLTIGQRPGGEGSKDFQFIVADTGIGIDDTTKTKLFKAFSQADSSYQRPYEGVGLGLAICSKLVDLLEGTIEVVSDIGIGSRFIVTLPIISEIEDEEKNMENQDSRKKLNALSRELRVLIVDDETDNANLARVLVKRMGGKPFVAFSGKEAVQLCTETAFDVILMDIRMPEMDGFEATTRIKADCPLNSEAAMIALTANVSPSVQSKCDNIGMVGFIHKPVHMRTLFVELEKIAST